MHPIVEHDDLPKDIKPKEEPTGTAQAFGAPSQYVAELQKIRHDGQLKVDAMRKASPSPISLTESAQTVLPVKRKGEQYTICIICLY